MVVVLCRIVVIFPSISHSTGGQVLKLTKTHLLHHYCWKLKSSLASIPSSEMVKPSLPPLAHLSATIQPRYFINMIDVALTVTSLYFLSLLKDYIEFSQLALNSIPH